jgi:hypothetical protein
MSTPPRRLHGVFPVAYYLSGFPNFPNADHSHPFTIEIDTPDSLPGLFAIRWVLD